MNTVNIDINKIVANPNQPRKNFEDDKLKSLSDSIKQFGLMQALNVRKNGDVYELISGERRLRASKIAGLKAVPCVLAEVGEDDSSIMSLIENVQREDLNFYELALSYKNILEKFSMTQKELATKLSLSQSSIANKLRILNLNKAMIDMIIQNNLTERHARVLLKIDDEKLRLRALKTIIKKGLNVRNSEELVEKLLKSDKKKRTVVKQSLKDLRIFTNSIKQVVQMGKDAGLEVDYDVEQTDDAYEITIIVEKK